MTNSEIWLDETLSNLKGIKSDLWTLHEIMSMPNCNDCKRKDCSYKPKWGEHIRYNCPLHLAEADRKDEPTISKMEQVDKDINVRSKDEPQTDWETEKRDNSLCYKCVKECDRRVLNRYTIECNQYEPKDEPQTEDADCDKCIWSVCNYNKAFAFEDEPQTDTDLKEVCREEDDEFTDRLIEEQLANKLLTDCAWR